MERPKAKRMTRMLLRTKPIRPGRTRRNPSIRGPHPLLRTSLRKLRSNTMLLRRSRSGMPVRMRLFFPDRAFYPTRETVRRAGRSIPERTSTRLISRRSRPQAAITSRFPVRGAASSFPSRPMFITRRFRLPHTVFSPSGAGLRWNRRIRTGVVSPATTTGFS